MSKIINIKKEPLGDAVYIGRENKWLGLPVSKWGNPFHLKKESDREEVLRKYKEYILSSPDLLAALPELKGKTLACYCFPKRCHGNVLIELMEELNEGKTYRDHP